MQDLASLRPSQNALFRAAELGSKMATTDDFFRPDVSRARRYDDYRCFRNAHREQWERTDEFVRVWMDQLFALAEKDGKSLGLRIDDSMSAWDVWYSRIVAPLKTVLWEAWERSCDLPARYAEAAHLSEPAEEVHSPVLQLAGIYAEQLAQRWGQSPGTNTAA